MSAPTFSFLSNVLKINKKLECRSECKGCEIEVKIASFASKKTNNDQQGGSISLRTFFWRYNFSKELS